MATTETSDPRPKPYLTLAVAGILSVAAPIASAAEFDPVVTIGITHSDNIFLESENEDSESIYRIEPGFSFTQEAPRVSIDVEYLLQAFRYHDIGDNEVFHLYDASIRAALVPEHFFLEVGANRSQSIVDPDQGIPLGNLPISSNRQNQDGYYAEPSFQYAFGRTVTATGEYRHTWVEYEESDFAANQQGLADFSIDNYRNGRGLTWALRYNWERTDYETEIPWEYQRATAELGFWITDATRVFAAGGQESAWDMPLDPKLEDELWEAGFSQNIGEKLVAEFAVGERSFGSSWRGNVDLEFRRGRTTLSYTEEPTSEGRIRLPQDTFDDPIEGPGIPDDFLNAPGTERFLAKRLQWSMELEFRRSGVVFALFDEDRTERTEADGTLLPDESHRGGSLSATYTVGVRTDFEIGGSWAKREFEDGNADELLQALFRANYHLGNRTTLTLEYEYSEEVGESVAAVQDYVVNTVSLLLTRTF